MNGLKGLEQQLYTVPPVSLRANAKVYAGGGKCLSFSFYILDAFSFFLFTFNKTRPTLISRVQDKNN